jgi:hypothetical protein
MGVRATKGEGVQKRPPLSYMPQKTVESVHSPGRYRLPLSAQNRNASLQI